VLTGFNTDIDCDGVTYHVQTEDRGTANPLIESLVYVKGEILATRRTEYSNLLEAGAEQPSIQILMERQHRNIVDAIRAGRIDLVTEPPVSEATDTTVRRRSPAPGKLDGSSAEAARLSQKSLDEVIADWLAEQRREERVRLRVQGGDDLKFGAPFSLSVSVQTSPGDLPVAGAAVAARFLSTALKPARLAEGTSDENGIVELKGAIPALEKGQGLLVVSVQHASGSDEVKFLVGR
jgi:Holliday junction resolvase-like predicted endonuclease